MARSRLPGLLAVTLPSLLGSLAAQVEWVEQSSSAALRRFGAAAAYDSARQRIVLFGGARGYSGGGWTLNSYKNDTWEFDGSSWVLRTPKTRPPARADHALAYDPVRRRVVLFGGIERTTGLADTWEWDGTEWTQRTPAMSPPGRHKHAMAYDRVRGTVLLFGGADGTRRASAGVRLGDTWDWDGMTWRPIATPVAPAARATPRMVTDPHRNRIVLFGGEILQSFRQFQSDVWEWDGSSWEQRAPSGAPGAPAGLWDNGVVYDTHRQRTVVVTMVAVTYTYVLVRTSEWDGAAWIERNPAVMPPLLGEPAMAYHEAGEFAVLLGNPLDYRCGVSPCVVNSAQTWLYRGTRLASARSLGNGCVGSLGPPALEFDPAGLPYIGGTMTVRLTGVPAGQPAFLWLGGSSTAWAGGSLPAPLDPIGMTGCTLWVSPDATVPLSGVAGVAEWSTAVCLCPSLLGAELFLQGGAVDPPANPLGVVVSNGVAGGLGER